MRRQAGFTLIELAVVMILIAGLAALLATQVPGYLTKRKIEQLSVALSQMGRAIETMRADEDCGPLYNFLTQGCQGETAPASAKDWLTSHGINLSTRFFRGMTWDVAVDSTASAYAEITVNNLPNQDICAKVAERFNALNGVTDVANGTDTAGYASSNASMRAVCDTTASPPVLKVRIAGYRTW
ncbi:type II secretion system protein [Thermosulfurimonas sp. F29]|uniref:type II secretion system protein n=1 Tax=Thermosulfurimonas sp. F29 TaxID=2867247 RepID=UPI001C83101B|nr:prepilin-type N-terminal cleavage/methylation domain-containing protein [Thermosulfurimonas sp. F29]MBX6423404.1 prepilin-type N-terminal cleavage/methylation domain-containing protein [Thermosulfurimonas sp. F29]